MKAEVLALTLGAALGALGCQGQIREPLVPESPGAVPRSGAPTKPRETPRPGPSSTPSPSPTTGPSPSPSPTAPVAAPRALPSSGLRRLSRAEYAASVRALLGAAAPVRVELLPLDGSSPFDNDVQDQAPSLAFVEATESLAHELGEWVVADEARARALAGCTPSGAGDEACFRRFLRGFGAAALRRPLSDAEVERLRAVQQYAVEDGSFWVGVRYAVAALLMHPEFLHRVELAGPRALTSPELATRLAYFLTGAPPEAWLRALDTLATDPAVLRSAAQRLLDSPAARRQLRRIHAMWLGYDRYADEGLYGAMREQSGQLVERTIFEDRDYLELYTTPDTWLDATLAAHYGEPTPTTAGWVRWSDPRRAGIVAHASVLSASSNTNDTSPTRRGKFVRERILCDVVPRPPPGVDVDNPPEGAPGACKSERYADHRRVSQCAGCHALMDPIGFGLEELDQLGRARTHDEGRPECPIDGRGEVAGLGVFRGPAELGELLESSGRVETCAAQRLTSYALGRALVPSEARDGAMIQHLAQAFRASGRRLRPLLLTLVTSEAFRTRLDPEAP